MKRFFYAAAFVDMNRIYRGRDFETVSLDVDGADKKPNANELLLTSEASFTDYVFPIGNGKRFAVAIGNNWNGKIPFTLLVKPGGKVVYAMQRTVNAYEVKKAIVDDL